MIVCTTSHIKKVGLKVYMSENYFVQVRHFHTRTESCLLLMKDNSYAFGNSVSCMKMHSLRTNCNRVCIHDIIAQIAKNTMKMMYQLLVFTHCNQTDMTVLKPGATLMKTMDGQ